MALLLRLPCHHQLCRRPLLLSSLHKLHNSSLSWPSSFHALPLKTNKTTHFLVHFSSTAEDPLLHSSSSVNAATSTEKEETVAASEEEQEEEYSRTRLLAQNVPWTCTAQDIRSLFEKFGTVLDVEFSMYDKTRNRGLAFVTMSSSEEAAAAFNSLESYEFEGRTLKMNYAKLKKKKPSPPARPKPGPTFNLFVANLHYEARDKDLKEFFIAEGANVVSAEIIFHDNPRRSSGYGFVAFKTKKEADEALSAFQKKIFKGRTLRVARSRQFARQRRKEPLQRDDTSTELNSDLEQSNIAAYS